METGEATTTMGAAEQLFCTVKQWWDADEKRGSGSLGKTLDTKLVVALFFQSACKGCHELIQSDMAPLYECFKDREGVRFVAVQTPFEAFDINTAQNARAFQVKHKLKFATGQDELLCPRGTEYKLSHLLAKVGAKGTPWCLIIDFRKSDKPRVYFNSFRFEWRSARRTIAQALGVSSDRKTPSVTISSSKVEA